MENTSQGETVQRGEDVAWSIASPPTLLHPTPPHPTRPHPLHRKRRAESYAVRKKNGQFSNIPNFPSSWCGFVFLVKVSVNPLSNPNCYIFLIGYLCWEKTTCLLLTRPFFLSLVITLSPAITCAFRTGCAGGAWTYVSHSHHQRLQSV